MKTQTAFQHYGRVVNETWFAVAFLALRIGIGGMFLYSGISKISGWTAATYLENATGPFSAFFQGLAGSGLVDQLNIWGLLLIGVALLLGLCVRPASFFGVILMLLYYLAQFEQNTAFGFIDIHLIVILVFVLFMAGGAGHVIGLDGLLYRTSKKQRLWSKMLFG